MCQRYFTHNKYGWNTYFFIANKGVKQVVISTQGQEKQRVTIVLSIAGNGAKLKPYFIFCGNSNSEN